MIVNFSITSKAELEAANEPGAGVEGGSSVDESHTVWAWLVFDLSETFEDLGSWVDE